MIPFAFPFASDPRKDIDGDARDGEGGEDGEDAPLLSLCKADSPLRVLHMQQMSHSKWFKRHQLRHCATAKKKHKASNKAIVDQLPIA